MLLSGSFLWIFNHCNRACHSRRIGLPLCR